MGQPTLDQWQVFENYLGEHRLTGLIVDDFRPKFTARLGERIYTSPVLSIDFATGTARTQNTEYKLLKPAPFVHPVQHG